ncbi:MAG: hypothetical protein A2942_03355 [Candidatus Lloydbacteria bacterium RIFCSPLOWO2_01_FULL_50_20]|uniref:Uncharacterized protein n=1 Tax=Candidatus Lloydbacteria bacterium RIFCSPLOWO2_01_FULL_50_20 TaxID=1798665 RepID=A0A1G2DG74_9BACT|nr:MAG: hypothetical protein A3C13_04915 [Candidatus Lloydbacteria bacterium RIFCSPHIGHO2_02_FULL_50_11]OGZ12635.1 MAG: hypothetical protein A2942_03355 [Candidatus Lloydbacteria bacterium RIFCSPLOWO2_01_FULL_50_20]
MSLRKILIVLGFLVAVVPYLGFPLWFKNLLLTLVGLTIVFFLTLFQKIRTRRETAEEKNEALVQRAEEPKTLHVERNEVEDYPEMRVEKEITFDRLSAGTLETKHIEESPDTDTTVEEKVNVVRLPTPLRQTGTKRKRNTDVAHTEEES